jgi:hypothetical protein
MKDRTTADPLKFLTQLRDSVPDAITVFTEGNCYKLFLLMKTVWPDAVPMYDQVVGHVFIKIGDKLYDIHGLVKAPDTLIRLGSEPNIARKAHRWKYEPQKV